MGIEYPSYQHSKRRSMQYANNVSVHFAHGETLLPLAQMHHNGQK
ncbi:hypothetical protein HMPREF6745_0059 [Prevotella sp. oral taxon 472 str. F0295]|nr:hypothetical protein HMPREF6745_0059 [Prevotella sp. oral taxon 472 str. F0295]